MQFDLMHFIHALMSTLSEGHKKMFVDVFFKVKRFLILFRRGGEESMLVGGHDPGVMLQQGLGNESCIW